MSSVLHVGRINHIAKYCEKSIVRISWSWTTSIPPPQNCPNGSPFVTETSARSTLSVKAPRVNQQNQGFQTDLLGSVESGVGGLVKTLRGLRRLNFATRDRVGRYLNFANTERVGRQLLSAKEQRSDHSSSALKS